MTPPSTPSTVEVGSAAPSHMKWFPLLIEKFAFRTNLSPEELEKTLRTGVGKRWFAPSPVEAEFTSSFSEDAKVFLSRLEPLTTDRIRDLAELRRLTIELGDTPEGGTRRTACVCSGSTTPFLPHPSEG